MEYKLEIRPALVPEERHKIQDVLENLGYDVCGGGQNVDGSVCDITFEKRIVDSLDIGE